MINQHNYIINSENCNNFSINKLYNFCNSQNQSQSCYNANYSIKCKSVKINYVPYTNIILLTD